MSEADNGAHIKTEPKVEKRKSRLESLKFSKKTIESPFKRLENLHLQSWFHNGICDALWAVLIRSQFDQEESLALFREIITVMRLNRPVYEGTFLTHSTMAGLSDEAFDSLMSPVLAHDRFRHAVSPVVLLDSIPDVNHWRRHLQIEDENDYWDRLAHAVGTSTNHQSQEATDVRWLKPMSHLANGMMHYPEHLTHLMEEIVAYPTKGDMKSVRPSIRANEGAMRTMEETEGKGGIAWSEAFWKECWEKTECILINPDIDAENIDREELGQQIGATANALLEHFIRSIVTTNMDARHDSSFGLVFYLLQLLSFTTTMRVGQALPARLILRTALEVYITLSFLTKKDDPTIWLQYRNYGSGQARLSFLKATDQEEVASFISADTLEALASEDFWHEFLDIKLGSWSNKNLREMATEAGIKPIYDRYYDALSGYVHGNWSAILHTSFGLCGNPLHRFHRIPHPPRRFKDDATPDLIKIVNLSLDLINSLYPPFKPRIRLTP